MNTITSISSHSHVASPFRRTMVKAGVSGLMGGFALSVMPSEAQELVITDNKGLIDGMVTVGADKIAAYRAYPVGAKNAPVVVVVQEIFGIHEHLRDIVRRFAKLGYYAIALELFQRQGDPKKITEIADIMKNIVAKIPDEQVMKDIDNAYAFAESEGASNTRRAITGFCWGGRIVWLYAAYSKALKAGVAWYGRLVDKSTPVNPLQAQYPVDVVANITAPVLGLYGGKDTGIPLSDVERMESALRTNKKNSVIQIYPEAGHGFYADYRSSYHDESATDGWKRAIEWFAKNGV